MTIVRTNRGEISMVFVILAGIIPAVILLSLGQSRRPVENNPASYNRWAKLLAISLGSMLGLVLLATAVMGESGSILVLLIMPSICALIAESILYWIAALSAAISSQNKLYLPWAAIHLFIVIVLLEWVVLIGRFVRPANGLCSGVHWWRLAISCGTEWDAGWRSPTRCWWGCSYLRCGEPIRRANFHFYPRSLHKLLNRCLH